MGLLDDLEFLKQQRKPNLLADVQQLQRPAEPYLRQQYPEVYGGLGGLLGMAPDEMAGSIFDPNTARVRAGAEYGFPVGTATQVVPALNLMKPAVAAGARALGPTAVRMGEGYLQRQGLMPQLDVYHGSPHKFDRFDASKIGTGEGSQSYGHGLYLAEEPKVGQRYQRQLSENKMKVAGDEIGLNRSGVYDATQAGKKLGIDDRAASMAMQDAAGHISILNNLRDQKVNYPKESYSNIFGETVSKAQAAADRAKLASIFKQARNAKKNIEFQVGGNLYKVDLPDQQIAKMLDWDKHLSEQSPEVQKILMPYQKEIGGSFGTGEQTLEAIAFERRMKGLDDSAAAVSQQLRDMGIPGIKYLDATSRGAGKGTRNFVMFPGEEQSLTILERNGQQVMPSIFPTSITRNEVKNIANDFAIQFKQMGFDVTVDHSGSKAGASSYLKVYDPQTGRFLEKPIRISDHSKGARELDANINVLNPQEDFAKITSVLNDMRAKGESEVFKQNRYAQELIASGVKPKTAYQRARTEIIENQPIRNIDISPEMRGGVKKGQPLFTAAPIGGIGLGAGMQDNEMPEAVRQYMANPTPGLLQDEEDRKKLGGLLYR